MTLIFPKLRFHANIILMLLAWLYLSFPILFAVLVLGPWGGVFSQLVWRVLLFLGTWAVGFLVLRRSLSVPGRLGRWLSAVPAQAQQSPALELPVMQLPVFQAPVLQAIFTALVYAAIYRLVAFLPEISTYPLSLGWSEVSRYYNASLFFAQQIYGVSTPPSVLHPTRYLMQSLAFLIPGAPLWFHRLWQVLLWWGFTLAAALILARRLDRQGRSPLPRIVYWSVVSWAVLMFFQGPVYYHLLVMVVLVVAGFDARHPVRTGLVVALASLWAGISRINWFPMPGLLAAALYLLELPVAQKPLWRYLAAPVTWCVTGTLLAAASERTYIFLSGNPVEQFGSSFSSDLLWYRLLPNPTYPIGILAASLLACGAAGLFLLVFFFLHRPQLHAVRWLGLAGILAVLFAGGILVSVKIGGGSNLHNLDAFLVMLVLVVAYFATSRHQPESTVPSPLPLPLWGRGSRQLPSPFGRGGSSQSQLRGEGFILHPSSLILLLAALLTPIIFALPAGSPMTPRNTAAARAVVEAIRSEAGQVTAQGGEVLFINQRHLLTFDQVGAVPLVPDYELVFLMEMTMSSNQPYLDMFHQKLQDQEFGLIVVEPLKEVTYGRSHNFGEENDAWVLQVSQPVLCYYETSRDFEALDVMLMTPRQQPCR